MNCKKASSLLSRLIDRQLKPSPETELSEHLAVCPACRKELELLQSDRQLLRSLAAPPAPAHLRTRVMAQIRINRSKTVAHTTPIVRALATAAAVLLIIGSACAGVALGSSFARLRQLAQETMFTETP